jgi:hypothetical protein
MQEKRFKVLNVVLMVCQIFALYYRQFDKRNFLKNKPDFFNIINNVNFFSHKEWCKNNETQENRAYMNMFVLYDFKAVPLHAMEALGGEEV